MEQEDTGSLAHEAIDFQKDDFGEKLTKYFEEVLGEISSLAKSKYPYGSVELHEKRALELSDMITKRTGLNVGVQLYGAGETRMNTVMTTNGNVLDAHSPSNYTPESAKKILDALSKVKQTTSVNIKTAKVTGAFKLLPFTLMVGLEHLIKAKLTPEEITAATLHEIGHAFTSLEFLSRFNTANQVLNAMTRSWDEDEKTREYVYALAGELVNGNRKTFESYEKIRDSKLITVIVIDAIKESFNSQTGSYYNDSVSSEQVADQFCARFGYARALMSGLEKLYGNGAWLDKSGAGARVFYMVASNMPSYVLGGVSVLSLALSPVTTVVAPAFAAITLLYAWLVASTDSRNSTTPKTYDDNVVRHKRIKEQVIEFLKEDKNPPAQIKKALEDMKVIEEIINKYNDTPYRTFITKALTFMSSKRKTDRDVAKLQRELEELASNSLFTKAAELKTLTT